MTKLNWIHKIFFAGNVILGLLLLLATFSPKLEPSSHEFIFMVGLGYPLLLALNILFVIYWLYQHKVHFLFSVLIITMGLSNISTLISFNISSPNEVQTDFTIMSFNVRLFNEYQWIKNETLDEEILAYISETDPDIIAFQEFINRNKPNLRFIDRMKKLGYKYYVVEPRGDKYKMQSFFGLATFSKYKIKDSGAAYQYPEESSSKTASLYTDIEINKQILRVYNTHLNSLKFISEDYKFVENLTENNESQAIEKSKNIISKVLVSAEKRQREVAKIHENIESCTYPVILLGDFNEPPYSYAYDQLTQNLSDAFLKTWVRTGNYF